MAINDLVSEVFWRTRLSDLAARLLVRGRRFVVMLHGVMQARRPNLPREAQPHHSRDELRQVLRFLRGRFSWLTPEELMSSDKPGILLTFDDGLANHYTNALPVLEEFQAPALFFVTTQHIQNPRDWLPAGVQVARRYWGTPEAVPEEIKIDFFDGMSEDQLRKLASHPLVTLGSHTLTHPFLTRCTEQAVKRELVDSRAYLEKCTGGTVHYFAYPTGDYNREVAAATKAAGYRAAFAIDQLGAGLAQFEIPRVGLYSANSAYLAMKLSGLHRRALHGAFE